MQDMDKIAFNFSFNFGWNMLSPCQWSRKELIHQKRSINDLKISLFNKKIVSLNFMAVFLESDFLEFCSNGNGYSF